MAVYEFRAKEEAINVKNRLVAHYRAVLPDPFRGESILKIKVEGRCLNIGDLNPGPLEKLAEKYNISMRVNR